MALWDLKSRFYCILDSLLKVKNINYKSTNNDFVNENIIKFECTNKLIKSTLYT